MTPWLVLASLLLQAAPSVRVADRETTWKDRVDVGGQIAALADALPRRDAAELRTSAGIDLTFRPSSAVRLKFEGFVEALTADRGGSISAAGVRIREAWVEVTGPRADLRAGFGRIVWGRLDEIQPSDVINPIDASRYLIDGRSAARLPIGFVRGRILASDKLTFEGVLAPAFRRGTFYELD